MDLPSFRALIERLAKDIPAEFHDGVVAVDVRPATVPHPVRAGVYTLGECVPLEWSGNGADLHSRILVYYGSFRALARGDAAFAWRREAWDTLSHELRHHLEWRANVAALEEYDWAAEENFKRHEGEPFDPVFYRSGERVVEGVWKVNDDVFMEGVGRGEWCPLVWHGAPYRVPLPPGIRPPAFLVLEGLTEPPPGDVVLVLPRRVTLFNFWRRVAVLEGAGAVAAVQQERGRL